MPDPPVVERRRFQHPTLDFRIDLPEVLESRTDIGGVALAAVVPPDPDRPDAFRANLNVTVEQPGEPLEDLEAYQRMGWEANERGLNRLDLWDQERMDVAGEACVRSLGHYLRGEWALVFEQWRLVRRGRGWVLTATMLPMQVPRLRPVFAEAVETLELGADA